MKLGVWPRIGIVASILWMLAAPVAMTSDELKDWQNRTLSMQDLCLKLTNNLPASSIPRAYEECSTDARKSSDSMIAARWSIYQGSLGLSAVALIMAWLMVGIGYGTVRWILNGRRNIRKPD